MNLKSFRSSLREKLKEQKLTLSSLASLSDLSEDTLRSIIYGKSQDIKLSTLIKIADVLQCSLDELINRNTYSHDVLLLIKRIKKLPKRSLTALEIIVSLEEKSMLHKSTLGKEVIPVFIPKGNMRDGMYYNGNIYEGLDISGYPINLIRDTTFGLLIQTEYYEPIYHPNDILLLSVNHNPRFYDIVLYINNNGRIFIRQYTDLGLIPIGKFGEIIPVSEMKNYTALGVVIKTVNEFDIEQYR